ncbi:MAG: hypothetical protein OXM02_13185 [Bacteroidota bacterium]|nr:hypothetical protein [Bacteroidota bacterium]
MAAANSIANFQGGLTGRRAELKAQTATFNLILWLIGGVGTLQPALFGYRLSQLCRRT